jgi:uncharacterized membrane protein
MADEDLETRRARRGSDRLIAFSDGVVAIAITLVVLPLVDEAADIGNRTVGQFIADDFYGFLAAAISFYSIARFWQAHHALFVRATGHSVRLIQVNFLWLAGVVFLPLATVLDVDQRAGSSTGTVIYILTLTWVWTLARVLEELMIREKLLDDRPSRRTAREELAAWLPVIVLLGAVVAVLIVPQVGLWSLFALVIVPPVARAIRGRAQPADDA